MEGEQNNVGEEVRTSTESGGPAGPIVGVVVILAILILGGLYFWNQRTNDKSTATDQTAESIKAQSTADDTASIETDLNQTQIENLDSELNAS